MQLSSHVHALRIPFTVFAGPVTLERFVYAYALVGDRVWLVDTGVSGSASLLLGLVTETGRSQADVGDILLTHSHVDHIGSAKALTDLTSANVHAHPAEQHWIEDVARQAKERPVPGFAKLCDAGVAVTHALADGQTIELAPALHAHVIATPGHSPGGVSFFIEEQGVLITGDAIPVKGDMPVYDDPAASIRSIAKLQALRGVQTLSSAWDQPRSGNEVAAVLAAGIQTIQGVHAAVRAATTSPETDAMGFCKEVVQRLDLPEPFANPMCLRTFLGHWKVRGISLTELAR